jgi:hypothetical protein
MTHIPQKAAEIDLILALWAPTKLAGLGDNILEQFSS